jgi:hypothetical protein
MNKEINLENYDPVNYFPETGVLPLAPSPNQEVNLEWEVLAPSSGSENRYTLTSQKEGSSRMSTRLSREGKELVDYNWQSIILSEGLNPESKDLSQLTIDEIKKRAEGVIEKLDQNENYDTKFLGLMKRSFEARERYLENQKFWSEMEASNSPWNKVIDTLSNTIYSGVNPSFVKNFSTKAFVDIKNEINTQVETYVNDGDINTEDKGFVVAAYESRLANHLVRHLEKANPSTVKKLKEDGIRNLTNNILNEKRFTDCDLENNEPLRGYMNKTLNGVLEEKEKVVNIKAEDINPQYFKKEAEKINLKEKLSQKISEFRQTLNRLAPNIKSKRKLLGDIAKVGALAGLATLVTFGEKEGWISPTKIQSLLNNQDKAVATQVSADLETALKTNEIENEQFNQDIKPVPSVKNTQIAMSTATKIAEPIVTSTATTEPTKTPTSTPEPLNMLGGIDFTQDENLRVDFLGEPDNLNFSFKPVFYDDNYNKEEAGAFLDSVEPGKKTSGIYTDKYGNLYAVCHSGYSGLSANECEALRQDIEGGGALQKHRTASEDEIRENLSTYVGDIVPITHEDSTISYFVIKAAGYVPHDLNEQYVSDTKNSLDTLIEANGGDTSPFNYYAGDKRALFIEFCGRPPENQSGSQGWYIWSKMVLALEPLDDINQSQIDSLIYQEVSFQTNSEVVAETQNTYLSEVQTIANTINEYSDKYPYDGTGQKPEVKLGEYIQKSSWYLNIPEEEKQRIETILDIINDKTYIYWSPDGTYQAIQCVDYEGLLYSLGNPEGPKYNAEGVESTYPGDAVDSFSPTKSISIESLAPGTVIITHKHITTVIQNQDGTVWLTDANRNQDGKVNIFSISTIEELENILGPSMAIR